MKAKILILDDSRSYCEFIRVSLSELNYEVFVAHTSARMWEIIAVEKIELLIIDWIIEEENGTDIAVEIRAHQGLRNLLIMMITSSGSDKISRLSMQVGCDDFVLKQEGFDHLEARISRLLFNLRNMDEENKKSVIEQIVAEEVLEQHKILIIDDEKIIRETLVRSFRREPYQISQAENGNEGIQKINELSPELVLLDLNMPGLSGLQVLHKLNINADTPFSVIVLTGHGGDTELKECYNLGVRAFLRKPMNPIELRALVKQSLDLNSYKNKLIANNRLLDQRLLQRAQDLELLNQTFRLFVPKQFVERAESSSKKTLQAGVSFIEKMTVLFSDIRSYTRISEFMTPQENFDFLNDYFSLMEPQITKNHGFIDKFIGDGLMVLFDKDNSETNSVKAAIDMQNKITAFNIQWTEKGNAAIEFGVGIHTGEVMIGTVGSVNRLDSTAVGDTVNTSSRLEQWTKRYHSKILISENVYINLAKENHYIRQVDTLKFNGKTKPITIYEVFDADSKELRDLKEATRPLLEAGIAFYKTAKFYDAIEVFRESILLFPEDAVPLEYIRRCQYHLKNRSNTEDWDGVTDGIEDLVIQFRRRSAPRMDFNTDVALKTKKMDHSITGNIKDISRYGLQLGTKEAMNIGDIIMVDLSHDIETEDADVKGSIELLSQVVWLRPSENNPEYQMLIGLEFVTLSMQQEEILHQIMLKLSPFKS